MAAPFHVRLLTGAATEAIVALAIRLFLILQLHTAPLRAT